MQLTTRSVSRRPWMVAALLPIVMAAGFTGAPALAQDSKSSGAAVELSKLLDAAKLDAIAAPDPANPTNWIAALYFKDGQLLVVSAQYAAPALFVEKAKTKDYRDIYIDLNSASVAGTKVFVQDQNCNGLALKPSGDDPADTWEEKARTIAFDGEWKKAKMSEADYQKAYGDADERYSRMLAALIAQAKPKSGS
jgi:hypothetical protein